MYFFSSPSIPPTPYYYSVFIDSNEGGKVENTEYF